MKTTQLVGIAIYIFLVMGTINPAQGRKLNLMSNLMKQADTLKHGLDLASQVGNIGSTNLNVAFTAVPSKAYSYKAGDIIRFDTIKINVGNGFNNATYRFTAPSAGLYVFSWSLAIPSNNRGQHNLMINGHGYQTLFCQHSYQQCGSTVTVSLKKYDQVWIKCLFDKIHIYGHYSSFSGWRLF